MAKKLTGYITGVRYNKRTKERGYRTEEKYEEPHKLRVYKEPKKLKKGNMKGNYLRANYGK